MDNNPTQAELEEYAAGLPMKWLHCRLFGCSQDPKSVTYHMVRLEGSRKKALEMTVWCRGKCGNHWVQLIDATTGLALNRLRKMYVKGFLAHGIGRIDADKKAVLRMEDINRRMDTVFFDNSEEEVS